MLDKTAVLKEAQKHLAKGAIDKAISELEKLVNESPDGNTFNTIGDLYLKKGTQKTATDYYRKAANFFWHEGFSQKAQALYKKVLNINPADTDALYSFGELSEEKGLVTDAIKYYLATADLLSKEGKKDRLIAIYEKILSLSPANILLRIKVADIFIREGLNSDAAREYLHIARIHEETGDHAKSKEFFQKAIGVHPRSKDAVLGLTHLYEKTGEFEQAAAQLKDATVLFPDDTDILFRCADLSLKIDDTGYARQCLMRIVEGNQQNVKARRMLGDLYLKAGATEKAWEQYLPVLHDILTEKNFEDAISLLETFKPLDPVEAGKRLISLFRQLEEKDRACDELVSLGDYYASHDMDEDAHSYYREALEINPEHSAARLRIASSPPEPVPSGESGPAGPVGIEIPDLVLESEEPDLSMRSVPEEITPETFGIPAGGMTEGPAAGITHGEKPFDEILTEVDIFCRYGLVLEAQKLLDGLKTRFPENIDVHLRLKALYMDTHEKELAVTECLILSELYRLNGDDVSFEQMLIEAHGIDPEDPRLAERGLARFVEPAPSAAPAAGGFGEAVSGSEPTIEDYEEEIAEADFYARQGLTTEAVKILEKLQTLFPENKNVIERLHALGHTPSLSDIEEMTGSIELSDTFDISEPSETPGEFKIAEMSGPDEGFQVTGEIEQPESSGLQGGTGMFEELELDENIPLDIEAVPKGAEELPQKAASEETAVSGGLPADAPEESTESAFEDFSFSETDLVEAQEMPEPSLDSDVLEIFQEFKKGLEKELGDDDAETHYNLGIAYKEMGLVDDAIKEFQTSKGDPKRFLQSSTMLGVCYMEKGLHTLAIDVLTKALESLKDKDESYWALSYELAEAYEKNQDLKEAVELYTSIYGWNAKFRDISDKMSLLPSQAPKAAENGRTKDTEKPKERKDRVSYL